MMKKKTPLLDLDTSVRRKRLNTSLTKKLNLSINSVQKQSLRANNRALAVNLERAKQELRTALEVNHELRKELQEREMRIVMLERVSGLKNEEIEEEVLRRVEQNHETLRGILTAMGENLFAVSHNLSEALHHCVQSSRRSTIGSRKTSSVGNSSNADLEVDVNGPAYQRSIYAQTKGSSLSLPKEALPTSEGGPAQSLPMFPISSHDMSVIAEQTMSLEDVEPLTDLDSALLNISDDLEVESGKSQNSEKEDKTKSHVSKLPQRVPRKERAVGITKEPSNTDNTDGGKDVEVMAEKEKKKIKENGKEKSRTSKDIKGGSSLEKKVKYKDKMDRRGTFVVADIGDLNSEMNSCPPAENETENSDDRRKTFVKPQSLLPEEPKDRRETFVVPPNSSESSENPEPMEEDDHTRYFNTDMEMTEVYNFTQQISTDSINNSNETSVSKSDDNNGSKKGEKNSQKESKIRVEDENDNKDVENSKKASEKKAAETVGKSNVAALKSKLEKMKSNEHSKSTKTSKRDKDESVEKTAEKKESEEPGKKDGEATGKSVVEMRVSKPGNFEYRASRKMDDGTRQPVPEKPVSRARSKGKVKLSKATSEVISTITKTPGKPKNVFDFGDRTPTVTLDVKSLYSDPNEEKEVKEKEVEKTSNSKKGHHEKESKDDSKKVKSNKDEDKKVKTNKPVKEPKLLPDNPVYYVPMAKGSPAVDREPVRQSRRSRSRPRTYKEASSDEEEEEEEDTEVKSKTKRQGRSKSRKRYSSGEEEQIGRRTRSQSRGRGREKKGEKREEDSDYESSAASEQIRSRGRSRKRRDSNSEEKVKVSKERTSRSRTRKSVVQEKENTDKAEQEEPNGGKGEDAEEVKIVRKTRSRSRARSMKEKVEEMGHQDKVCQDKLSETEVNEIDLDIQPNSCAGEISNDETSQKSSKSFLESLRKSSGSKEKGEVEQTKSFLASLAGSKEQERTSRKSDRQEEVLVSVSSDEDTAREVVPEGQGLSVNESLVEVNSDSREEMSSSSASAKMRTKRKHEEVDEDNGRLKEKKGKESNKMEEKKARDGAELKTVSSKTEAKKTSEGSQEDTSRKHRENKDKTTTSESVSPISAVSVEDRLSHFVRERGHTKPTVVDDNDDITFSDFDKLYKHVSAKRATESSSGVKVNNQEGAAKGEKKENDVAKISHKSPLLKTPEMPRRKSQKSAVKSKSKKSSKKKSQDNQSAKKSKCHQQSETTPKSLGSEKSKSHQGSEKTQNNHGMEKENTAENVSSSKEKLALLKKRLTEIGHRKPSIDPLSDIQLAQSLPSSPNSEEPDKKRPRRGGPVSYKEKPLNSKIRRGDAFFDRS
ncbi:serine/arginine repetitive matrix protein 2-like [Saccostrea echinata]|uniref:serine/arginine repetitive matrix protein 2-like n=1 Tax=Saccostrea echinata TaxID=191078 RepID=UPI002A81C6EB|nr:serine/arginine repetitive matrix protein 2-like [Saccostrea echinata]